MSTIEELSKKLAEMEKFSLTMKTEREKLLKEKADLEARLKQTVREIQENIRRVNDQHMIFNRLNTEYEKLLEERKRNMGRIPGSNFGNN